MVNLNVRLDESEHTRLDQACKGRGCDRSTFVREAIRAALQSGAQPAGPQTPKEELPPAAAKLGDERKYHPGYCRGYHIDPETKLPIMSRPGRVATDEEIKELTA